MKLKFIHFSACATFAASFFVFQKPAFAGCTLFLDPNWSGPSWEIADNARINYEDLAANYWSRRSWHGYLNGWKGSDRNWDNAISSAKSTSMCLLELYEDPDFKKLTARLSPGKHDLVPKQDSASSVYCNCTPPPPPPPVPLN